MICARVCSPCARGACPCASPWVLGVGLPLAKRLDPRTLALSILPRQIQPLPPTALLLLLPRRLARRPARLKHHLGAKAFPTPGLGAGTGR